MHKPSNKSGGHVIVAIAFIVAAWWQWPCRSPSLSSLCGGGQVVVTTTTTCCRGTGHARLIVVVVVVAAWWWPRCCRRHRRLRHGCVVAVAMSLSLSLSSLRGGGHDVDVLSWHWPRMSRRRDAVALAICVTSLLLCRVWPSRALSL